MTNAPIAPERKSLALKLPSGFAQLSYTLYDPPGATRSVMCLHDYLGNSAEFSRLATLLAGNGLRVICPDMPGRGESAYLDPADYNAHTYMLALMSLGLTVADKTFSVVGKGWGALLGAGLGQLPEIRMRRLIAADLGLPFVLNVDEAVVAAARGDGFHSREEGLALLAATAEFKGIGERQAQVVISPRLRAHEGGYRLNFDPALLQPDVRAPLARIPTLRVLQGYDGQLLYIAAGPVSPRDRSKLARIMARPDRVIAERVSRAGRVHFTGGHEMLLTLGALTNAFIPS